MSVLPTACRNKACPAITTEDYCERCRAVRTADRRNRRRQERSPRELGYDRRWDRVSVAYRKKHPVCEDCEAKGHTTPAELVHHKWPVAFGGAMYDEDNLRALCSKCHRDKHSSRVKGFASTVVVCGPPGSGKTSYALERLEWGDLLVDLDFIWSALTGLPRHAHPEPAWPLVRDVRDLLYERLRSPTSVERAWVIETAPAASRRIELARELRTSDVIVLEVPPEECKRRIRADANRSRDTDRHLDLVEGWWGRYTRWEGDTVIRWEDETGAAA